MSDRIIAVRTGKTIFRDGDRVIKQFERDYPKADVISEALNQARIEETGLKVPRVIEVSETEGRTAIVSEYIKGCSLEQLMRNEPSRRDEYLEKLAAAQLEVHAAAAPLLPTLFQKLSRHIDSAPISPSARKSLHRLLDSLPNGAEICHGDFVPSNLIVSEKGKLFVLDWAHAAQGDGSADAAASYLRMRITGEIDTAESYLSIYCRSSGSDEEQIKRWIPPAALWLAPHFRGRQRADLLSMAENFGGNL